MAGRQITNERLEAIIAAYGSVPEKWPEAERSEATALLDDTRARDTLLEAARLDALLERAERPIPSNMLKANLLDGAVTALASRTIRPNTRQSDRSLGLAGLIESLTTLRPWALGSVMAPVLALGIWIGAIMTSEPIDEEELFAAFGEDYELWTESEPSLSSEETGEM